MNIVPILRLVSDLVAKYQSKEFGLPYNKVCFRPDYSSSGSYSAQVGETDASDEGSHLASNFEGEEAVDRETEEWRKRERGTSNTGMVTGMVSDLTAIFKAMRFEESIFMFNIMTLA